MESTARLWVAAGAASAALSVVAGAFGAHALSGRLEAALLSAFETGARYQMYHALALIAAGLLPRAAPPGRAARFFDAGAVCFVTGTVLFSGSLYALALTGLRALGAVTPFGGLLLILGWICFLAAALSMPLRTRGSTP